MTASTGLWETIWREHAITSERNAALLNWRYEKNGQGGGLFTIFALVGDDERVAAYAVYRVRDGIRHLVDLAAPPSRVVVDALLSELIRRLATAWRARHSRCSISARQTC